MAYFAPGNRSVDGLRHHVRRRVAQHLTAVVGVGRDDRDRGVVVDRAAEVVPVAVDPGGERRLGQAGPDRRGELGGGGAPGHVARAAVGERDRDLARCPLLAIGRNYPRPRHGSRVD